GGTQRGELDPLRTQHTSEVHVYAGPRIGVCGGSGSHCSAPSVLAAACGAPEAYAPSPAVRVMNASSNEARCGVSSCSTMPAAAAASPTWGASRPETSSKEGSTEVTVTPSRCSAAARSVAWGER